MEMKTIAFFNNKGGVGTTTLVYQLGWTLADRGMRVLGADHEGKDKRIEEDAYCLSVLRHYRSLMPMAQSVRKPIFKLTAADGAIGAHSQAVREVSREFGDLADKILRGIASAP